MPKHRTPGKNAKALDADLKSSVNKQRLHVLAPGIGATVAGLLAAALLLWRGPIHDGNQQQLEQLSQAWGGVQAGVLQQVYRQMADDTRQAASNPQLLQALRSRDQATIATAEQALTYWDGVVDAQINLPGKAVQNAKRAAPMNFAAMDLLNRLEKGQNPPPEAYKIGGRWLIYSVAPLRGADDQPAPGTLLLIYDLQRLVSLLPAMPEGTGRLELIQQFSNAPQQILFSIGQAVDAPALQLPGSNPNLKISFTPGPQLTRTSTSPMYALAFLVALGGALLGLLLTQKNKQRELNEDVEQLQHMLAEIASGKQIKAFRMSHTALNELAQCLADLPQRRMESQEQPLINRNNGIATPGPLPEVFDALDIDILEESEALPTPRKAQAQAPQPTETTLPPPELPDSIFRAYDIRGVVGDTLTATAAYWIGRAIGSESLALDETEIAVARDGRLSGPELMQALIQGLMDCGCRVIDIGMVPTPVLYYATNVLEARSGVMVTGSHNPPDYNGFKIVIAGNTLANEEISALHRRIQQNDLAKGIGSLEQLDILERYFRQIYDGIAIAKHMKVVVDCGNGVAGVIAPRLIEALGCSVIPLYCEVDGTFPNHHPDPGKEENLKDLIAKVKSANADLGLAFDGDGDRVGVVTCAGKIIYPDRLLMLFAKDVVSRNPGADVIFDVKCTRRLPALISAYGGRPIMWKTGHSLIKKKMKETGALLAGEMSGHIFFKERWYGFDDGLYSAARLLEILSLATRDSEQLFAALPISPSTPEININIAEEHKFQLIERLQKDAQWGAANLTTLDGLRADYAKGWGLVRASNTTPMLVLRFEADNVEELARIQSTFRAQLLKVEPDLNIPF